MRVSSTVLKVSCAPYKVSCAPYKVSCAPYKVSSAPYNSYPLHIPMFILNIALKQRAVPSLAVCCVPSV